MIFYCLFVLHTISCSYQRYRSNLGIIVCRRDEHADAEKTLGVEQLVIEIVRDAKEEGMVNCEPLV